MNALAQIETLVRTSPPSVHRAHRCVGARPVTLAVVNRSETVAARVYAQPRVLKSGIDALSTKSGPPLADRSLTPWYLFPLLDYAALPPSPFPSRSVAHSVRIAAWGRPACAQGDGPRRYTPTLTPFTAAHTAHQRTGDAIAT